MTPAQQVAIDAMRSAWPEADVRAMLAGQLLLAALLVARKTMQNEHYNKPRIGMEADCAVVDDAIRSALLSPAENPDGASTPRPPAETPEPECGQRLYREPGDAAWCQRPPDHVGACGTLPAPLRENDAF